MFRQKMFGQSIDPSCAYCSHGRQLPGQDRIICSRCGIVSPGYHCGKFSYDPLRRVPKRPLLLPDFDQKDFTL